MLVSNHITRMRSDALTVVCLERHDILRLLGSVRACSRYFDCEYEIVMKIVESKFSAGTGELSS